MRILAIETSCDETSIAILETDKNGSFKILSNIVSSQVKIHAPYGGVVPTLAKREHQKNLVPILLAALKEAGLLQKIQNSKYQILNKSKIQNPKFKTLNTILERESELLKKLTPFLKKYQKPNIDLIAVTNGPGLEPALWVGVSFAKALGYFWDLPVIPVNHVEGHIAANWIDTPQLSFPRKRESRSWIPGQARDDKKDANKFPAVCLVVSGGHTQLILMHDFGQYKILGETRDDAAGEAFDKLAKMLNLGYPGGPIISHIARRFNILISKYPNIQNVKLPRPMINSKDYDFSFSGLKTAALYFVKTLDKKTLKKLTPAICAEFQQAVVDVLINKTLRAAKEYKAKTIILGGGVVANQELRKQFEQKIQKEIPNSLFMIPDSNFCTDNAAMIALTAYLKTKKLKLQTKNWKQIKVDANLRIS